MNDFGRQWDDVRADALRVFEMVGASGWYILGERVRRFEAALGSFWGLSEAVGVASGLDAIEIALRAAGMKPGDRVLTTPLSAFATTLARLNPNMVLTHVSGARTNGTEKGRLMWARVKGRAENALMQLPFKGVYNFRPGLMTPKPGQKHVKALFRAALGLAPVMKLFFPALTLEQVGRAMIRCVKSGAPQLVLEGPDIAALAGSK